MNAKIPPRLHVMLARESDKAIIIRRGPSKYTAVIGWDREKNNFYLGQWVKGKIFHHRCDISPDGKHWIYFAHHKKYGKTYTAVAKVPYLRAIDFYTKADAWNGGGIFLKNDTYWLNEGAYSEHVLEKKGNLLVEKNAELNKAVDGEDAGIYFYKLRRSGWEEKNTEILDKHNCKVYFHKRIDQKVILCKIFYTGLDRPMGKGCYYESHEVIDLENNRKWEFRDWEWADSDGKCFTWAEYGKIMQGNIGENGIENIKELFDTNSLLYEEIKAPYE